MTLTLLYQPVIIWWPGVTIQTPYNYCANVTGVCLCAVAPYYFHLLWSIKSFTLSLSTILSSLWIGHNCPLLWQRELLKLVYCNNMQVITIDKIYISQLRMKNEEHLKHFRQYEYDLIWIKILRDDLMKSWELHQHPTSCYFDRRIKFYTPRKLSCIFCLLS